jgi:Uma2 family endonuclease
MQKATRLITAEELEKLPDDGHRYELVKGRLVRMTPVSPRHSETVAQMIFLLKRHVGHRSRGSVGTELGVILERDPDTVRAPDVAFVRRERMPVTPNRGFFTGAPDLAVEVLSPNDRSGDVQEKVDEYLERGTLIVLVVNPQKETVTIVRHRAPAVTFARPDDVIDLDDAVPGFRCTVGEIFE